MATAKEIGEILALIQAAFPNYKPGVAGPDALYQLLRDLPGDLLKVAVLDTCAQAGRAFAPSVGEIRAAALKLHRRIHHVPDEFEAWAELQQRPGSMQRKSVLLDAEGNVQLDEQGRAIILVEQLHWSHPLVGHVARMLGWPDFPGENESTDRAHFLQAYRAQSERKLAEAGELPAVSRFVEAMQLEGPHPYPLHTSGEGKRLPGPRKPALLKDVLKP